MRIDSLFEIKVAKSKSTDDYSSGEIPFVTNTEINNGVVAYVEPLQDDKVFDGPAICVSGLGFATVHFGKFLPKGNGGDSCTVFLPIKTMDKHEILYYAALFNTLHGWRFSFGRKTSKTRLESLILSPDPKAIGIDLKLAFSDISSDLSKMLKSKEKELNT